MAERERSKGIVPHLIVKDCPRAIEFYKTAFGAEEVFRMPAPDGKRILHAELRIGPATIFICDDFPEYRGGKPGTAEALGGTPVTLHQNVLDCDAAIARAAAAGATVTMPAQDMFWGDRYGQVRDPSGHMWAFGAPIDAVNAIGKK
jgi:PhnB protein